MSRRTIVILALLLCVALANGSASAQPRQADVATLQNRLSEVEGHERVRLLIALMREQYGREPAEARAYGHEALRILRARPDAALRADVLCFLGGALFRLNVRDSAEVYLRESLALAVRSAEAVRSERGDYRRLLERAGEAERLIGHLQHEAGAYAEAEASYERARDRLEIAGNRGRVATVTNDLAVLYKTQGRYADALTYHTLALSILEVEGQEAEAANARHGLGVVYNLMGRSSEALEEFRLVLEFHERQGDSEAIANTLSNIGGAYEYQGDHQQALSHFLRAHEIYSSMGLRRRIGSSLTNVANAHFHLGQIDEARAAYERARDIAVETGNVRLIAYIDEGMGRLYEHENDVPRARQAFDAALAGFEQLGDRRGIATALISLGRLRNDTQSTALVSRAVAIAEEMRSHQLLSEGNAVLAGLYEREGRYADALEAHKRHKAAYDSLFNSENQLAIARLETEYQTKEQQQRISLLEQRRRSQRMLIFGLLSGVGFLSAITALHFNRVRLRQRALAATEQMHRAEAEKARLAAEAADARAQVLQVENERKAQELEAARRMQLSMLPRDVPAHPNAELITFMRTAAEVGGDYYDYDVAPDGTLTIAIGDATGHGTQAGTMVAAVKSLFSDYARAPDLAQVLRRAARALRRMGLPSVYMAFALARLRGATLELAGAGMPPALIYRADTGTVDEVSLRGMPLGAPADFPYAVQTATMNIGDTLVLMSDGAPELRNEAGAEFGYVRTKELVQQVGCCDVRYIVRMLEETIDAWRGERGLFDDVTVLVMKIKDDGAPSVAARSVS